MYAKVKALREERVALVKEAQKLLAKEGQLSKEDEAKFDKLMEDADIKAAEITRFEKLMKVESELNARLEQRAGRENITLGEQQIKDEEHQGAFMAWMRSGMEGLTEEQRRIMMAVRGFAPGSIQAAQGVGSAGAGGALVPQAFMDRLEVALKFYGGMLSVAETVDTDTGADCPWPTVNDTSQTGAILAENATITGQDITFSSVTLKAYMYTSKLIAVSLQLMQDAAFGVDNLVADIAGQRLGRILNTHFTTGLGSGSSQPNGIVTAAASGKTGTTGQTTSVIYDDLIDLIYSVDRAYRQGAQFMMNDASVKVVRKLKDGQSRPIWMDGNLNTYGATTGEPAMLLGYPVVVNNDVATMSANAKSILFGALNKYKVRRVKGVSLVRLNERYMDALQIGFFAFARFDGNLIDAGTNPVKYYANSAT
jgi:HK97 family phage major capsid protein